MSGFDQWRGSRRGVGCLGFLVALGCGCGYAPKTGRTTFNGQDAATRAQQPGPQDASATTAAEPASPRIELADTVRLAEDRLYLLGEQRGLVAFDVSDIDRPREVWTVPVAGDPLALFVRKGVAILVIAAGFESRTSRSYLRVMDVLAARPPVVRQELPVSGSVRDVHALGDVFYALSEVGFRPRHIVGRPIFVPPRRRDASRAGFDPRGRCHSVVCRRDDEDRARVPDGRCAGHGGDVRRGRAWRCALGPRFAARPWFGPAEARTATRRRRALCSSRHESAGGLAAGPLRRRRARS